MKTFLWKKLAAAFAVGLCTLNLIGVAQAAIPLPPVLNVSTDLDQLPGKYMTTNMTPNNPSLDSAQLLADALLWVSNYNSANPTTPYTTIKAERGAYYFSTPTKVGGRCAYVVIQPPNPKDLENVTIDFDGSDLFFQQAAYEAFTINGCRNLTLKNFSIDYLTLPFTQLLVQGILNSTQIVVIPQQVQPPQPQYVTVYQLSQSQNQKGTKFYGFDFRNGQPQYTSGRWDVEAPTVDSGTTLTLQEDTSSIQVNDIFEVEARGGGPAIWLEASPDIQLKNIAIYSTGGVGIITNYSAGVSIQNVSIVPRPGTNRLVSTNAGGIAINQTAANNTVQNCTIVGTQDDSISGNSPALGYSQQPVYLGQMLVLSQPFTSLVIPGQKVYFVDPKTVTPIRDLLTLKLAIRTIETVVPSGSNLNVTVTTELPPLPAYAMMYDINRATRGDNLLIDSNTIASNTLARGIALSGQTGVTISDNVITSTEEAGILCANGYGPDPKDTAIHSTYGPMSHLRIENNVLIDTDAGTGQYLSISQLAAIQLVIGNLNDGPAKFPVCRDIVITHNKIVNTPRTGIWIMNALGGRVAGNTLTNTGYDPMLLPPSHIPSGYHITGSQAMTDFETPLLIQHSAIVVGKNPVE